MKTDFELFEGKNLSALFKDIYDNSTNNRKQLKVLLGEVAEFINNVDTAKLMVPVIKEYLEINVKNDEQLVKLAGIVQKLLSAENRESGDDIGLSSVEKKELLKTVNNTVQELQNTSDELTSELESTSKKVKTSQQLD